MNPKPPAHSPDSPVVGIIGAGHLGRALAAAHRQAGFPEGPLLISHGGSPKTAAAIRSAGLAGNVTTNEEIFQRASLIFVAIRPQSLLSLPRLPVRPSATVISCMAGISTRILRDLWDIPVHRVMPSGPETILAGKSIAGVYPGSPAVRGHLQKIGLDTIVLQDEEQMHELTAGVCLPAALLLAEDRNHETVTGMGTGQLFPQVLSWAREVSPKHLTGPERTAFVSRMSTPGGITEAVCRSIGNGNSLLQAYLDGIRRSREIGEEMSGLIRIGQQ